MFFSQVPREIIDYYLRIEKLTTTRIVKQVFLILYSVYVLFICTHEPNVSVLWGGIRAKVLMFCSIALHMVCGNFTIECTRSECGKYRV